MLFIQPGVQLCWLAWWNAELSISINSRGRSSRAGRRRRDLPAGAGLDHGGKGCVGAITHIRPRQSQAPYYRASPDSVPGACPQRVPQDGRVCVTLRPPPAFAISKYRRKKQTARLVPARPSSGGRTLATLHTVIFVDSCNCEERRRLPPANQPENQEEHPQQVSRKKPPGLPRGKFPDGRQPEPEGGLSLPGDEFLNEFSVISHKSLP